MEKTADVSKPSIELNNFLKVVGIINTGGRAKIIIRSGSVKVNGGIETRNKRKLHAGDIVECDGKNFAVEEKYVR